MTLTPGRLIWLIMLREVPRLCLLQPAFSINFEPFFLHSKLFNFLSVRLFVFFCRVLNTKNININFERLIGSNFDEIDDPMITKKCSKRSQNLFFGHNAPTTFSFCRHKGWSFFLSNNQLNEWKTTWCKAVITVDAYIFVSQLQVRTNNNRVGAMS